MVSVFFADTVSPNARQTSTITSIILASPCGDRETMQASSAYSTCKQPINDTAVVINDTLLGVVVVVWFPQLITPLDPNHTILSLVQYVQQIDQLLSVLSIIIGVCCQSDSQGGRRTTKQNYFRNYPHKSTRREIHTTNQFLGAGGKTNLCSSLEASFTRHHICLEGMR